MGAGRQGDPAGEGVGRGGIVGRGRGCALGPGALAGPGAGGGWTRGRAPSLAVEEPLPREEGAGPTAPSRVVGPVFRSFPPCVTSTLLPPPTPVGPRHPGALAAPALVPTRPLRAHAPGAVLPPRPGPPPRSGSRPLGSRLPNLERLHPGRARTSALPPRGPRTPGAPISTRPPPIRRARGPDRTPFRVSSPKRRTGRFITLGLSRPG